MAYPSSLDVLRTDLTGADDAAVVDHAGLHNAVNAAVMAVQAELGLDPSGAAATVAARLAAIEADSRWTNARTPTAHKASHAAGGSDALSPADIGAATSAQGAKADTAVQPTLIDAKGDLLVGAAADNLMRLPAAADGRLLTTDGSQSVGVRWATPTTRVGSGSPLGIVVPDFAGQEFVDTLQTLGAREWVATGTTAASWVVSDGVTPTYNLLPLFTAPAGTNLNTCTVRRVGPRIVWNIKILQTSGAARLDTLLGVLPAEWRPFADVWSQAFFDDIGVNEKRFAHYAGTVKIRHMDGSAGWCFLRPDYLAPTAWPTAAPV